MYPLSDVGCIGDALNVDHDIAGELSRHPDLGLADAREVARRPRDGEFGSSDSSLNFCDDIAFFCRASEV